MSKQVMIEATKAYQDGRYQEAIEKYSQVLSTNPNLADCYLHRASVFYTMDQYDKCVDDCKRAFQLGCKHQQVYKLLSQCYHKQKNFVECKKILKIALTSYPQSKKLQILMKEVLEKELVSNEDNYMEMMLSKMCQHPKVRTYLKDESFLTKVQMLIKSPTMIHQLAKADPRILEAYEAMLLSQEY